MKTELENERSRLEVKGLSKEKMTQHLFTLTLQLATKAGRCWRRWVEERKRAWEKMVEE